MPVLSVLRVNIRQAEQLVSIAPLVRGALLLVYKLLLAQERVHLARTQLQAPHLVLSVQLIPTALPLVFQHLHAQSYVLETLFRQLEVQLVPIVNARLTHIVALEQPQFKEIAVTILTVIALFAILELQRMA